MSDGQSGLEAHEIVDGWRREFEDGAAVALRWVPLAEAERAAGVARSTLRAWFRSGQLPSRVEPGPHGPQRVVPLEAVLDRARRSPARRSPRRSGDRDEAATSVAALAERLVETLTSRAEERAAAAEAALRAALERAAAAETEVRVLREQLNLRQ